MTDHSVKQELEVFVGTDDIVRLNVDGLCVLRLKLQPGATLVHTGPGRHGLVLYSTVMVYDD